MRLEPVRGRKVPPKCGWCAQAARFRCDGQAEDGSLCGAVSCDRHGVAVSQSKSICVDCARRAGKWQG